MPDAGELQTIQRWLQAVITHPEGVSSGVSSAAAQQWLAVAGQNVEQVILPSSELTSLDRLQIYGQAYYGRLLECLRAQYPAVRYAVGDAAFDGMAFGYLVAHPSTRYTLSALGTAFPDYLATIRPPRAETLDSHEPDFADFLIELGGLEQVYSEVFDGPGPERSRSLTAQDLVGLSPERFLSSRLRLHDCVRLLEFSFPVHEYATQVRRGSNPIPPASRQVLLVVTRREYFVRRDEITRPQFRLLSALKQGRTVGEAIEELYVNAPVDSQALSADLEVWFRAWSAAPLFAEWNAPAHEMSRDSVFLATESESANPTFF